MWRSSSSNGKARNDRFKSLDVPPLTATDSAMTAHFTVPRVALAPAVEFAARVADKRATMPILSHVIMTAEDGRVRITGSDLMVSGEASVAADVTVPGSIALSGAQVAKIAKGQRASDIEFVGLDNHWAEVRCGRSHYKVQGLPPSEFPILPNPETAAHGGGPVEWTALPAPQFASLISQVDGAMSAEVSRVNLNGVFFQTKGEELNLVATDGHRLAKATATIPFPPCDQGILVPRAGIIELLRMIGGSDIEIGVGKLFMFVRSKDCAMSVKLTNAQFPPYEQVIPKVHSHRLQVSAEPLLRGLNTLRLLSDKPDNHASLRFKGGTLTMTRDDPDHGVAEDSMDVDFDGNDFEMKLNGAYLDEAIRSSGADSVELELQGPMDPMIVKADGFVGVVMPMRS